MVPTMPSRVLMQRRLPLMYKRQIQQENIITINVSFNTVKFPEDYIVPETPQHVWMRVSYISEGGREFIATGIDLPAHRKWCYKLYGIWEKNGNFRPTFKVVYYETLLPQTEKGFIDYVSLLGVGIGRIKAREIYRFFGDKIWDYLESDPEKLLIIDGINERKIRKLVDKLSDVLVERQLATLFADIIDLSPLRVKSIKDKLGTKDLIKKLTDNPYLLCMLNGFTFAEADRLGDRVKIPADDLRRIAAAADSILEENASSGHVCFPKQHVLKSVVSLLNSKDKRKKVCLFKQVDSETVKKSLSQLCVEKHLYYRSGMIYTEKNYRHETGVIEELCRLIKPLPASKIDVDPLITAYENEQGYTLENQQRAAVKTVLSNKVSIITGGPGTGKSTVIRTVLWVFNKIQGRNNAKPVLLAPTGRAARRMTEATGYDATTIHHMIKYDGEKEPSSDYISGNLFIIDEASMVDQYIAYMLFRKIPDHARLLLVGDSDQLPSVGAGNVLDDLISSQVIPIARLTRVFRQSEGNAIIANAAKIREGRLDLDYSTKNFFLYETSNSRALFQQASGMYMASARKYGPQNVILLNAYRNKTDLSVVEFNRHIQHNFNPLREGEAIVRVGRKEFRMRDRVMQMNNRSYAKNGDVGTIINIYEKGEYEDFELITVVTFDDGVTVQYDSDMVKDLDLAYCTTVYKSQGSEYKIVIMVVSDQHNILNNRASVYTGITRSSEIAVVFTEAAVEGMNAFNYAISNNVPKRYTLLAPRLSAALIEREKEAEKIIYMPSA